MELYNRLGILGMVWLRFEKKLRKYLRQEVLIIMKYLRGSLYIFEGVLDKVENIGMIG